jgi:hemoglobin/transferrin/lactoferrin receptor protein
VQGNTTFIESQIQNVGEASIYGIELNAEYRFGGFLIGATYADTEGKREDTGEELNSVRPESGTLYIGWSGLDDRLVLQAEVESFGGKTELGDGGVIGDSTESATLGNLFVGYAITDNLVLKGRINNVTDEFYRRFDQIDNGIGRNFRVEALYRF